MLLVSFRYERSLSHSPNSKPASINVSKHGAKRISRNRSIYKYHFLYWCCIRHPKSHIRARNRSTICLRISRALLTTSVLLWPLVAWNVNPVRHYSRHLRWWKPAQLSLTSLHPLQGSQPTNKRVGYIMQPPGHEN